MRVVRLQSHGVAPDTVRVRPPTDDQGTSVATELETGTISPIETDADRRLQEPGDHDRFAHYVPKAELTKAMVTGVPCTALCGKKWVPSRKPEDYPVCPDCKRIYDAKKASEN